MSGAGETGGAFTDGWCMNMTAGEWCQGVDSQLSDGPLEPGFL